MSELITVESLFNRIIKIENSIEDLFYSLLASRASKKAIEDILELAVIEYFNIENSRSFRGSFIKPGNVRSRPKEEQDIIEARKWFMCMMRYMLEKTTFHMKPNYEFYHHKKERAHRHVFLRAQTPQSPEDYKNRDILHGISAIVKRISAEEGLHDERFDL